MMVSGPMVSITGWVCSNGRMGAYIKASGLTAGKTAKANSRESMGQCMRANGKMGSTMERENS